MSHAIGVPRTPMLVFLSDGQPHDPQQSFNAMSSLCRDFPALQVQCVHFAEAKDEKGQKVLRRVSECAGSNGTMRLAADSIQLQNVFAEMISTINAQTATMRGGNGSS